MTTKEYWRLIAQHNIDRRDSGEITPMECIQNAKAFKKELLPFDDVPLLYVSEALKEHKSL